MSGRHCGLVMSFQLFALQSVHQLHLPYQVIISVDEENAKQAALSGQ